MFARSFDNSKDLKITMYYVFASLFNYSVQLPHFLTLPRSLSLSTNGKRGSSVTLNSLYNGELMVVFEFTSDNMFECDFYSC